MSNVATKLEIENLVRNDQLRTKALAIISNRRRPNLYFLVTFFIMVTFWSFVALGMRLPVGPILIVSTACGLLLPALVEIWLMQRRLQAVIDILLLDEETTIG